LENNLTWRVIRRLVKRHLYNGTTPFHILSEEDHITAYFDICRQIQLLLCRYLDDIMEYRHALRKNNGDVLCSCSDIFVEDPLILHLHLSTDGGHIYTYRKHSIWPVHCTVLDLPLCLRSKRDNLIMISLWEGRRKPDWITHLSQHLSDSMIGKTTEMVINGKSIKILIRFHTAVFDLPAAARVLNHIQFNGKFGCLYCCAPGSMIKSGRGHSRKYGPVVDQFSDGQFEEYSDLAENLQESFFGIKGKSSK